MRGILVAEKMDVIAENREEGTLLVEQRQSDKARPIPTTINVSTVPAGTRIDMAIKMERGCFPRSSEIRPYMCGLLAKVKGGKEGPRRSVAQARTTPGDRQPGRVRVLADDRQRGEQERDRGQRPPQGRKYTLSGRIETPDGGWRGLQP